MTAALARRRSLGGGLPRHPSRYRDDMATATDTTELQATARPTACTCGAPIRTPRRLRLLELVSCASSTVTWAATSRPPRCSAKPRSRCPNRSARWTVPTLRLGLGHLADLTVLADPATGPTPIGASLRWFADLARLAHAVVQVGRVRPHPRDRRAGG